MPSEDDTKSEEIKENFKTNLFSVCWEQWCTQKKRNCAQMLLNLSRHEIRIEKSGCEEHWNINNGLIEPQFFLMSEALTDVHQLFYSWLRLQNYKTKCVRMNVPLSGECLVSYQLDTLYILAHSPGRATLVFCNWHDLRLIDNIIIGRRQGITNK